MLHEADASLACWLADVLPSGTRVSFDAPHAGWSSDPPDPPLLDAFLCEVAQDDDPRPAGWSPVRDADGRTVGRQQPPRRYLLRYLVTAWTAGPAEAGHELLGALLCAGAGLDALPAACLRGRLAAAGLPVLLRCAPAVRDSGAAHWWAGFGLAPRTMLELHLIVPVLPAPDGELAPPAREISLDMTGPAAGTEPGTPIGRHTVGGHGRRWERTRISERKVRPGAE